jgi:hypothetical protein
MPEPTKDWRIGHINDFAFPHVLHTKANELRICGFSCEPTKPAEKGRRTLR